MTVDDSRSKRKCSRCGGDPTSHVPPCPGGPDGRYDPLYQLEVLVFNHKSRMQRAECSELSSLRSFYNAAEMLVGKRWPMRSDPIDRVRVAVEISERQQRAAWDALKEKIDDLRAGARKCDECGEPRLWHAPRCSQYVEVD